jgi:putative membrane protein
MESNSSLSRSIDDASKHYSSLFFLPSFKKALLSVAVICIFAVGLSTFALLRSIQGLADSLVLGISLFAITLMADLIVSKLLLRSDPIFSLRRTLLLSLFSWLFWLLFLVAGVGLSFPFGFLLWVKLCLLGYSAIITLRIIVLMTTSTAASWRKGLSVLLQPTLCLAVFVVFWTAVSSVIPLQVLPFIIISPVIGFVAVILFFSSIERLSQKTCSMPSMNALFRAFIVNWVTEQNAPLEKYLEGMGEDADIEVNLLKFDSSKPKAAILVPLVHPGPFKNIGSSLLPSLLKHGFEKEYGCDTCTPLGLLGHELDLTSQEQNYKIVSQVIASAKFESTANVASPFVRVIEGAATASGQIFGDTVFLSFTLAPRTTEDLPHELGCFVSEEAAKYGLGGAVIVNTHNSLTDLVDTEEHLGELQTAASKCLQKAVRLPTKQFLVGSATVYPEEFSIKDGMGTGGITAIVVQVEKQKTVYVVIDGNNMIPDLREKILAALTSMGFDESEVFTTDTHAVSALVTGRRGYHPVGEVMDHDLLTRYICEVAKKAEANLETSNAGYLRFVVPHVRVIGEARLKSITTLVDRGIQKAKQTSIPIFGLEGLFLILLLTISLR